MRTKTTTTGIALSTKGVLSTIRLSPIFRRLRGIGLTNPPIQVQGGDVKKLWNRLNQIDAFSFPELMGCIAIIAVLAGMLIPAVCLNRCESAEIAAKRELQTLNGAYQNYVAAGGVVLSNTAPVEQAYAAVKGKVGDVGPFLIREGGLPHFDTCTGPKDVVWGEGGFTTPSPTPEPTASPAPSATATPSATVTPSPTPSLGMTISAPEFALLWHNATVSINLAPSEALQNVTVSVPVPASLYYQLPANSPLPSPLTQADYNRWLWYGDYDSNEEALASWGFATFDDFLQASPWLAGVTSVDEMLQLYNSLGILEADTFTWTGSVPEGGLALSFDVVAQAAGATSLNATATSSVGTVTASTTLTIGATPTPTPLPTPSPTPAAVYTLSLVNNSQYGVSVPSLPSVQLRLACTTAGTATVNLESTIPVVCAFADGSATMPAPSTSWSWTGMLSAGQTKTITLQMFAGQAGTYSITATADNGDFASAQIVGVDGKALAYELVSKAKAARSLGYKSAWNPEGYAYMKGYYAAVALSTGINGIAMPQMGNPWPNSPGQTWANRANYNEYIEYVVHPNVTAVVPPEQIHAPQYLASVPATLTYQHFTAGGYEVRTKPISYDFTTNTFTVVFDSDEGTPGPQTLDWVRLQEGDISWQPNPTWDGTTVSLNGEGAYIASTPPAAQDDLAFINKPISPLVAFGGSTGNASVVTGWQDNYRLINGEWLQISSSYQNPF